MKRILIIFLLSFINSIAQDYYSIYDNNGKISKFYFIQQNDSIYKSNLIYIKLNRNESLDNLQALIYEIIKENSVNDFKIHRINRPFEKFTNQLLNVNTLSKIIQFKFESKSSSWLISKILQESGKFAYVVPERIYKFSSINSNDPLNDKTNYLDSLQASEIWEFVKGDSSIAIGIVDSGVDLAHDDLKNVKRNKNEIFADHIDNDNNGFVDDYFGWDFVGDVNAYELFNGALKPDWDVNPNNKYNNHGTHVAGISCAETNNNRGISSLGYNLSFIPVKVSADDISQLNYVEKPFEGILYALNRGADIINCSWLDDDYNPLAQDIVNEVASRGSIVVCAAGNSSLDNYYFPFLSPASLENVISVGALNPDSSPSAFTHFGWNVDVFAPGVGIYSTIMENNYDFKSGTSMSSPIVASLVGLMKKLHPDWSFKQIELQLRANANKMTNYSDSDSTRYWGAINPLKTLENNYKQHKSNPGISINDYFFDDVTEINEINIDYELNLGIKNYLSAAQNVSLQLIPLVDYIIIDDKEFSLNNLSNDESTDYKINLKLNSQTPYFEGSIPILVVIKANNYRNLEIINIPYKIESSTKFLAAQYFADYLDNGWLAAKSPSKYSLWLIGNKHTNGRGMIFSFGSSYDPTYTTKNPTAIFPFDDKKAIVALQSGNLSENTEIAITKNGGLSFSTIDKPFSEIYDIHFYNSVNGIVVGSNNSSYFGIKTSKDGGNSWSFSPLIVAEQNEQIIKLASKNSKSIFLTSNNNIYYSDSLGLIWSKLGKINSKDSINKILLSENKTIAVFSSFNKITTLYYSLNLDTNWSQNQINLSSKIVNAFFLENTEIIYCLLENGEIIYTEDYFKTYDFILNQEAKFGKLYLGADFIDSCGIRIWQINYNLYFSDIENVDPQSIGNLNIVGRNQIDFDTLEIEKTSASEILFITNTGKKVLSILEQKLSENSDGSFSIEKKYPKYILPCQLFDAKVVFAPKKSGWHFDTLTIKSENEIIQFPLIGYAYDPSSVFDYEKSYFKITPNPALEYITFNLDRWSPPSKWTTSDIEIYDVMGVLVAQTSSSVLNGQTGTSDPPRIDVSNLAPGVYFVKIGDKVEKFIKY